jgi:YVTN family beta-propeller protein
MMRGSPSPFETRLSGAPQGAGSPSKRALCSKRALSLALTLWSPRERASRRARAVHGFVLLLTLTGPARAEPLAYITAQGADALSIVDLAQGRVVETVKIGKKPAGVAVASGGNRIYATNPESHSFSVIERDQGAHRVVAEIAVGGGPLGLALDPQGKRIFIADWYADQVHEFDAQSLKPTAAIKVGTSPAGMAADPDGAHLYVANRESDTVSVIDLATRKTVATIPVGKAPFGVTYDATGPRVFVANVQSGDVSVIDPATFRETRRLKVRSFPYAVAVAANGDRIFVTNQHDDSVTVFDGKTFAELKTLEVCGYPEGALVAPDGEVYVACWMDDVLARIDPKSLTVKAKIPVNASPRAFGQFIAPDLAPSPRFSGERAGGEGQGRYLDAVRTAPKSFPDDAEDDSPAPHHMSSATRASSDMRLWSHGGEKTILTSTPATPGTDDTAFSTHTGISPATGQPGAVRVMSILTKWLSSISTR